MPDIEELEHRLTRLEDLYEDVLKEKLTAITARLDRVDARFDRVDARLDQLYEKTERDKSEILAKLYEKTERDKTELISKIADVLIKTEKDKTELLTKIEQYKTDILTKTEKDKRELIYWMVGLGIGFLTLTITALWAILSFALKQ